MMYRFLRRFFFVLMVFFMGLAVAQGTQTVPVRVSDRTQNINSKEYYIHIVQQGQTVFSIARAYGLKYYDAVIKTDIHQLKVGDTVWLPKNDLSTSAVAAAGSKTSVDDYLANAVRYVHVDAGQTLYNLSRTYGVSIESIVEINPELKTEQLKAGQMIKIPPRGTDKVNSDKEVKLQQNEQKPDNAKTVTNSDNTPKAVEPQKTNTKAANTATASNESAAKAEPSRKVTEANTTIADEEVVSTGLEVAKPIVNPYSFAEVPSDFPKQQAAFYNFKTPSSFGFQVRDRQSKEKVYVSVMMPLNLDKIGEISTSKFDIEQRGKRQYKVFEFVQFYEGILMALDELEKRGCHVVLNVVDVSSESDADVERAFKDHDVANSDFVVALLVKKPFQKVAELAKEHQVFVINPFSSRDEVVTDNPYVIKYMPSVHGVVKTLLDMVAVHHKGEQLVVVHSGNKARSGDEALYMAELQRQLDERKDIKYTLFDWSANAKLTQTLKQNKHNVMLSVFNQDKNKNTVYVTTLLNRLSTLGSEVPTLMSTFNFIDEFANIDYEQLQNVNYTTPTVGYLDYARPLHKEFIDTYKTKFRTEPNTLYAGVAHDIVLYFVSALWQQGSEFWRHPESFSSPKGMLFPLRMNQSTTQGGYENQAVDVYRMTNFKLMPLNLK